MTRPAQSAGLLRPKAKKAGDALGDDPAGAQHREHRQGRAQGGRTRYLYIPCVSFMATGFSTRSIFRFSEPMKLVSSSDLASQSTNP